MMKERKLLKQIAMCFTFAVIVSAFALPGIRAEAAAQYGQISSSWRKAGNYSYQLKQDGTLVFKANSGKVYTIAKKVSSARYYGTKVAYAGEEIYNEKTDEYTTHCGIYNCVSKKTIKEYNLKGVRENSKSSLLLALGEINGFYGNTITFYCGWSSYCLASVNMKTGSVKLLTAGKRFGGSVQPGAVQQGKYLVYVHRHYDTYIDTLDVYDMSTGKTKVITKKGYAALVQNNKIYFAEVLREKEHYGKTGELLYDIPKQTVKIYSSSLTGGGRKLLGSFKTKGNYLRNYMDEVYLGDLAIIPTGTTVYVYMRGASPEYYSMNYKNGKLVKSTASAFNKKGKLDGLVSEGVTWAWMAN